MPARRELTPGAFDPLATRKLVCVKGYAAQHRLPLWEGLQLKKQAMERYGISPLNPLNWAAYTADHLVPLELGGLSTLKNVWPQLKAEAKRKDVDEDQTRISVCAGAITLAGGQQGMIDRWCR